MMATLLESLSSLDAATLVVLLLLAKATLILMISRVLLAALPTATAASRHLIGALALGAILALPLFTVTLPQWELPVLPSGPSTPADSSWLVAENEPGSEIEVVAPRASRLVETVALKAGLAPVAYGIPAEQASPVATATPIQRVDTLALFLGIWFGGAVLLLAYFAAGLGRLAWIVKRAAADAGQDAENTTLLMKARGLALEVAMDLGLEKTPEILQSGRIRVPILWGISNPTIVLPEAALEWDEDRLRVVLAHELAHVVRRDWLTLMVTRVATAVYWFHPLAWTASLTMRHDCERATDDLVLLRGARPSDYAEHLLSIARELPLTEPIGPVSLAMSRASQLEGRLVAILHPRIARGVVSRRLCTTALVTVAALLIPLSNLSLVANTPPTRITPSAVTPIRHLDLQPPAEECVPSDQPELLNEPDQESPDPEPVILALETPDDIDEAFRDLSAWNARVAFQTPSNFELVSNHKSGTKRSKAEPQTAQEWYGLAYELHGDDRFDEARQAFQKAFDLGYRQQTAAYNIACGYAQQNDVPHAIEWLSKALSLGFSRVGHLQGDSDLDPIRADPRFRAILADWDAKHASRDKSEDSARNDRLAQARAEFERLGRSNSSNGELWRKNGRALASIGRLDEAREALTKAVRLLGDRGAGAMYDLGCVQARSGHDAEAFQWLEKSIVNGVDNAPHMKKDRDLVTLHGDPRFDQAIELSDSLSLNRWTNDNDRELAAGRKHFETLTRQNPSSGRAWFNLGFILLRLNESNQAIDALDHALTLGFRKGVSSYNIACGHAKLGQIDTAFQWLDRAFALDPQLRHHALGDKDLKSLRNDRRFRDLEKSIRKDKPEVEIILDREVRTEKSKETRVRKKEGSVRSTSTATSSYTVKTQEVIEDR